jgi:HSP20 family protein
VEAPATGWTPRVDLSETEDAYHIHLDLPGVDKDDVDINLQDGTLTIRGERKEETREEGTNAVRVERSFGQFFRSFTLPQTIKQDAIRATYDNGVLAVEVPKAEETKPRRIEIS